MACAGKTSLAKALAKKFRLKFYDGGDVLKMIAKGSGYKVSRSKDWWDTPEGLRFLKDRRSDPDFDYRLDKKLFELADRGGVVFTSWALPWIYPKGTKIWLSASAVVRARRMSARDNISLKQARAAIRKRDRDNMALYRKLYDIRLGTDLKPFDIIIDTDRLDAKHVAVVAIRRIDELLKKTSI